MDTHRQPCSPESGPAPAVSGYSRRAQAGIALFVVLVVAVVVMVVVTQLTFTSKIEERVSENRKGFLELSYSLQSVARDVMLRIYNDWVADLDQAEGGESGTGTGGTSGTTAPVPLGSGMGGGMNTASAGGPVDARHEQEWAHRYQVQINGIDVEVEISDGESRLNVNHLFDYVQIEAEAEDTVGTVTDATAPPIDETGINEDPLLVTDEEYEPPSEERIELTRDMLSWLVEAVVAYNLDWGFEYVDLPRPDAVADAIVDFVLSRQAIEETRRFHRTDFIRALVGPELYYGPLDPYAEEDAEAEGAGPWPGAGSLDGFSPGGLSRRGNGSGGLDSWMSGASDLGFDGGLLADMGVQLDEASGYRPAEDGLGVEAVPRPLGLRQLFTAHASQRESTLDIPGSSSKLPPAINLNTARPEVIVALSRQSFEAQYGPQPQAFEEALRAAWRIDLWLNSLASDEAAAGAEAGTAGGGTSALDQAAALLGGVQGVGGTGADATLDDPGVEPAPPEFNVLRSTDDLRKVAEDDPDFPNWASDVSEDISQEKSTTTLLTDALKDVAVFRSNFFTAILRGSLRDQPLEGELVLERHEDPAGKQVRVVYWREAMR